MTGHVDSFGQTYTDPKTGELVMLKRPQMKLSGVSIPTGGLGPMPKAVTEQRRNLDPTIVRPAAAAKYQPAVDEVPAF